MDKEGGRRGQSSLSHRDSPRALNIDTNLGQGALGAQLAARSTSLSVELINFTHSHNMAKSLIKSVINGQSRGLAGVGRGTLSGCHAHVGN